jgi:hypothetical protein
VYRARYSGHPCSSLTGSRRAGQPGLCRSRWRCSSSIRGRSAPSAMNRTSILLVLAGSASSWQVGPNVAGDAEPVRRVSTLARGDSQPSRAQSIIWPAGTGKPAGVDREYVEPVRLVHRARNARPSCSWLIAVGSTVSRGCHRHDSCRPDARVLACARHECHAQAGGAPALGVSGDRRVALPMLVDVVAAEGGGALMASTAGTRISSGS